MLTAALAKGDLQASKDALELYDAMWNGIEVYVNMRSLSMYLKLEADLQGDLEDGLGGDAPPDFAGAEGEVRGAGRTFRRRHQDQPNGGTR